MVIGRWGVKITEKTTMSDKEVDELRDKLSELDFQDIVINFLKDTEWLERVTVSELS